MLGDLLEVLALIVLAVAGYLWFGLAAGCTVAGVGLFYLAQVHAETPRPTLRLRRNKADQTPDTPQ